MSPGRTWSPALQTVASRTVNPLDAAVVSVTQMHSGDTWNVISEEAVIRGTTRAFKEEMQEHLEAEIRRISSGIGATFDVGVEVHYERRYPPTINDAAETDLTAAVARKIAGEDRVFLDKDPMMGAEDFAFMLNEKPGAYVDGQRPPKRAAACFTTQTTTSTTMPCRSAPATGRNWWKRAWQAEALKAQYSCLRGNDGRRDIARDPREGGDFLFRGHTQKSKRPGAAG